jgi:hypothetical protein
MAEIATQAAVAAGLNYVHVIRTIGPIGRLMAASAADAAGRTTDRTAGRIVLQNVPDRYHPGARMIIQAIDIN